MAEYDSTRWFIYLLLGPPLVGVFFVVRSRYWRLLAIFAAIIFIEEVFLKSRQFFGLSFGLTAALIYATLASLALVPAARQRMGSLSFAWGALLSFALIGAVIGSLTPGLSLRYTMPIFQQQYLELMLCFWLGRAVFDDAEEVRQMLMVLVVFAGVVAVLHLFTLVTGIAFHGRRSRADVVAEVVADTRDATYRDGSVFSDPNTLADYYAMMLPIGIVLLQSRLKLTRRARLLVILSIVAIGVSLPLTASRGGVLAVSIVLIVTMSMLHVRIDRIIGITFGFLLAGLLMLLLSQYVFPEFFERAMARFEEEGLQSNRFLLWWRTLVMVAENPFGIGLHEVSYMYALRPYYETYLGNPHNMYLRVLTTTGFLGLFAFLALLGGVLRRAWVARRFGDPALQTVATALFLGLLGYIVGGMAHPIFKNYKLGHFFWLLAGIASYLPAFIPARARAEAARFVASPFLEPAAAPSPVAGAARRPTPS